MWHIMPIIIIELTKPTVEVTYFSDNYNLAPSNKNYVILVYRV